MSNIRDRDALERATWAWDFLNGCCNNPNIRVSDVDGIINRAFRDLGESINLFIEGKSIVNGHHAQVSTGQRILFNSHLARGDSVLVLWGHRPDSKSSYISEPVMMQVWPNPPVHCCAVEVREFVNEWDAQAKQRCQERVESRKKIEKDAATYRLIVKISSSDIGANDIERIATWIDGRDRRVI